MTEPHLGWFRVEEEAMRLIDRSWDKLCNARSAANCYVTLCRIANLKGNDVFEVSIASLARDMHCVYRDAQRALALVESIGLVKIERRKIPGTKENAPSIYTVVRTRPDFMSAPTDNVSEGHGRDHVHDPSRSFPKNGSKNSQEPQRTRSADALLLSNEKFKEAWKTHLESIRDREDRKTLANRHLGLCKRWADEHGIEATIARLEQAQDHDPSFLMEPSDHFPSQDRNETEAT